MIKTAAKIIKGVFRKRARRVSSFDKISWFKEKIIKHQEDQSVKAIELNGQKIHYKRPYELLHSYKDIFQSEIYKFQSKNSTALILDCGSNIGLGVLYFKKLYPAAKIIAFEPDTSNFSVLTKNVESNNLKDVSLNKSAVWIKEGKISFSADASEASRISEGPSEIEVPCISLRQLLQSYPKIDFLKMDIEGAEWEVINDCKEELSRIENMFLEYHGLASETSRLAKLFKIIEDNGFSTYIKNAADNLNHPFQDKLTGSRYDVQLNIFCYR